MSADVQGPVAGMSGSFIERDFPIDPGRQTLFYLEGPSNGSPLLLIHGVTSRWQPFQPIMPTLALQYQVFAVDLRGHGRSSHTAGAYCLDDYTGDLYQFIEHRVRQPAVIYGHSLGSLIAVNVAAQHPECVSSLILGDPPLYYHNTVTRDTLWYEAFTELLNFMIEYPGPAKMHARLDQIAPNMPAEKREERVRSLENLDADVVRAIIADELMKDIPFAARVRRVACPVLLLRGDEKLGSALREQDVDFARADFQHIRVLDMEGVGHGIIPVILLPQLVSFIEESLRDRGTAHSPFFPL